MTEEFSPFSLLGKKVLVTGASSGIGRAIAICCAKMGAEVYLQGRNEKRLQETLSLLSDRNHRIIAGDLTIDEHRVSIVNQLPMLDGVVHCAGIGHRKVCKQIDRVDVEEVMEVNFGAPVLLQSTLLSQKKIKKSASIVFVASRAASSPSIGNAVYSASKGAIISYAKCLALELAPRLIRVNCICPAMVWTDLILQGGISKEELEQAQLNYPLKRYGTPDDVAYLTVYLLSNVSSWMTGTCVDITGGGE
ncbi:SDR family NAD(P)-dependent oxidoreductase [Parabacteroides sp. ZJ-118]|uniref:SDR family NAD(P)-dependent oxidoreductase n=1 Tax=Parabacteroides sp. ZJ-118 TaxID=2709398 RepID=UPI0013EBE0AF|nr:SDR family oxidoreductase [Parabacteroides sp. ZJ-118]